MMRMMNRRMGVGRFSRTRPTAAGFSLLEILISIFIILFGLLGLVSLLPVGRYEMAQTQIYDYSAACGRAGLHEIKARRMLGSAINSSGGAALSTYANAVVLDPLGYWKKPSNQATFSVGGTTTIPRFTLPGSASADKMGIELAERVFRWQDDTAFDVPTDSGTRPKQLYSVTLSTVTTSAASGIVPQSEGNYSWMAMVTPLTSSSGVPTYYYTVSIVVFYKRDFTEPSCGVTVLNSGSVYPQSVTDVTLDNTALEVRENRWILLTSTGGIYQWYRVVATGDAAGASTRSVSLAGPDWPSAPLPTKAVVPPGVVGVYTETVELDQ